MAPSPDDDFYRRPPPPGRSRESTIVLAKDGRFFHDGELVEHPRMGEAMHGWISRHPDDGRFILDNGYDWTYFTVEDVPYFVKSIRIEPLADGREAWLRLSDGSEEPLDPATVSSRTNGEIYLRVKAGAPGGPFAAKLTRFAQTQLEPLLEAAGDAVALATRRGRIVLG